MGKLKLKSFIPVGVGLLTFATLVGSISGSLAWWAYSTRVSVSYQGTSVSTSEQLQIGLRLDTTIFGADEIEELGLTADPSVSTPEYTYAFANAGGGLSADLIAKYIEIEGKYATDELVPVTSNSYVENQDLVLYENLLSGHPTNTEHALTEKYVFVPFIFRILRLNAVGEEDKYLANKEIYVSNVIADAMLPGSSSELIQNALRIHFNDGSQKFILHSGDHSYRKDMSEAQKAAAIANMYTPVAGLLDLNSDGYFDAAGGKEILYGDCSVTTENTFVQSGTPTKLSDINSVYNDVTDPDDKDAILSDLTNASTFISRHPSGVTCYEDYDGINIGRAYYKTLDMVAPDESHGALTDGIAVCTTSNDAKAIAELDTTIWLEGWDHQIIDQSLEPDYKFNLVLQFQIDLFN